MLRPTATAHPVLRWVVTVAVVLFVGTVVFWPAPPTTEVNGLLNRILTTAHSLGLPQFVDGAVVEFCANIVFFVPVGAVAAWWFASPLTALGIGVLATCLIETIQGAFLPNRVADPRDVLSNSLGALVAVTIVALSRRRRNRPRGRRQREVNAAG